MSRESDDTWHQSENPDHHRDPRSDNSRAMHSCSLEPRLVTKPTTGSLPHLRPLAGGLAGRAALVGRQTARDMGIDSARMSDIIGYVPLLSCEHHLSNSIRTSWSVDG